MNSKERFIAAIHKKQPDRVPMFDYLFCQELYQHVLGIKPEAYDYKLAIDLAVALGHDAVWAPTLSAKSFKSASSEETYKDEWGTVYKRVDVSWPLDPPYDYPVKCKEDFAKIQIPDASRPERYTALKEAVKYANEHGQIAVMGSLLGPFSLAWLLMGPEYLFTAIYEEPELIDDIFKSYLEYAKVCIKNNAESGIDCLIIAEDLGYGNGVFYSPDKMRENLFPYLKEMVDTAHALHLPVFLHCDGNINVILKDIVDLGVDALHPLERKAHMDLRTIKQHYGDKLCLIGNVDSCEVLALGSLEDVEKATMECLKFGAPNGGYVLASDHSLSMGVKVENVLKMYEVHKKYRAYPICL